MKIFELEINEHEDGVNMVALVDNPAIKRNWIAFDEDFVKPQVGEEKNDYMKRCIPIVIDEGKDPEQAVAVCSSMYDSEKYSEQKFKVQNEEKRVVTGPLMVANLPIYRFNEELGDHYVVFRPEVIEKIVLKFFKDKKTDQANIMHDGVQVDGVYLFESFIIDERKPTPIGFDKLPNGSWFGSFKVENDAVWEQVKAGEFAGFSVEGMFAYGSEKDKEDELLAKLLEVLKG